MTELISEMFALVVGSIGIVWAFSLDWKLTAAWLLILWGNNITTYKKIRKGR